MPTPITTPGRLPARGTGIFDYQATGLPDWDCAEAADRDPAEPEDWEPTDWEPADWEPADWDLADDLPEWESADPEKEPPELAMPDPGALDPTAERRGLGSAAGGDGEALKARRSGPTRGDGGWFAAGGVADGLVPGARLAGFMADARTIGLGRLTDDELIGVMRAARRLASWSAAMELAAAGDLWRRRWSEEQAGDTGAACRADDEIAAALTLTGRAAGHVLSLAIALRRLPLTSRALSSGDIDLPRAMVIADEVTGLDNEHAAGVEQAIIGAAPGQTTGQLRAVTRRAVLSADPRAARKRKERALQDARVERWDEHGGTAALAGRDLPPVSVLAADQNLSALARQLQRAGVPGTLDQLRAQVYLALLTGASVGSMFPAGPGTASGMSSGDSPWGFPGLGVSANPRLTHHGTSANRGASGTTASPGTPGTGAGPDTPAAFFTSGTVNLTMPLASWLGLSDAPGTVAGYGPLDAEDSRALADALTARAGTRWCLTLTDSHGRPVVHGCARGAPPPGPHHVERSTGPPGAHGAASDDRTAGGAHDGPADSPRDGPRTGAAGRPRARAPDRTWTFSLTLLTGGECDHAGETSAYRPSPGLRHLLEIRHATCTYPGCRRPAARCDADHTVAYHQGGRTCLCNLAPLCRHHHEVKQSPGWRLDQPSPGVMTWTTPAGRRHTVGPSDYPD